MTVASIRNFLALEERLLTGGQPSEEQLRDAAARGVQTVINLAPVNPEYSLRDEGGLVRALGMEYVHIPVRWEAPSRADLEQFMQAMAAHADRKLLVHCAANMRASAFIACDRVLRQGWPRDRALADMRRVWDPGEYPAWRAFLAEMLPPHEPDAR